MNRRMSIPAGERTRVFRLFSSSIPSTINFDAMAPGGEVSGTVEIDRWHWFSWKRSTQPLQASNTVDKGFGDADFLIHVTPDQDCEITFQRKSFGGALWITVLIAVVIVGIAAAMIVLTAPPSGG